MLQRLRNQHMVVGEQNLRTLHAELTFDGACAGDDAPSGASPVVTGTTRLVAGTHTSILVPRDGAESTRTVPRSTRRRSRMLTNPRPALRSGLSTSKPRPESSIVRRMPSE